MKSGFGPADYGSRGARVANMHRGYGLELQTVQQMSATGVSGEVRRMR